MADLRNDSLPDRVNSMFRPLSYYLDISLDAGLILVAEALTLAFVYIPVLNDSFMRYVLAFLMVLFVPGYAFIAAVFPRKNALSGLEVLVISIAASIAFVSLIGYALNFTGFGVRPGPVLISVIIFTTLCTLIATRRRNGLPREERFEIGIRQQVSGLLAYCSPSTHGFSGKAMNAVLVLGLIMFGVTVWSVAFAPGYPEHFTELIVLGPDGKVADLPAELRVNATSPVLVSVVNHEHQDMNYVLAAYLDDGASRTPIYSEPITVGDNQTWEKLVDLKPATTGSHVKVGFDLFSGGAATAPYRSVYLWVNISPGIDVSGTLYRVGPYSSGR